MISLGLKIGVLIFMAAIYFFVPGVREFAETGITFLHYRDFDGLRAFILSYGFWAPLTSIALMTLQSAVPFVPGLIITITNAWIFGWLPGAFYSSVGALLGAVLDFGLARWYGRPIVRKFAAEKHIDLLDSFFQSHGVAAVFLARLTPVIPFKVVSYSLGLTAISLFKFTLATALGQTPAIVLYSVLGQDVLRNMRALLGVTALLLGVGVLAFYYRRSIEIYLSALRPKKEE